MEIPASAIFSLVMERGLPRVEGLGVWGIACSQCLDEIVGDPFAHRGLTCLIILN